LSFAVYADDSVSVKCHAGCDTEQILSALGGFVKRDLFPPSRNGRQIVAAYDYTDEKGKLLFQAVRFEPKDFRQRRPDGKGGWMWNLDGVRRVPYRLPDVRRAIEEGTRVWIVEGEKDAETLEELHLCATTNPGGAGKWRAEYNEHFKAARVTIIPDRDEPGCKHAEQVARSLHAIAESVRIIELPDGKDATEWIQKHGGSKAKLWDLVKMTPRWEPPTESEQSDTGDDTPGEPDEQDPVDSEVKDTQAASLVRMAEEAGVELFHEPGANPVGFASVPINGHVETHRLKSSMFRTWLKGTFYRAQGKPPGAQALQDALGVLEAKAIFDGQEYTVHVRVANHDGKIYLDLCNDAWQVVEVDADGWRVVNSAPVKFRRARAMLSLPAPETGGSLQLLRRRVNVRDEDWPLFLACLIAALRPIGPYPALVLFGEQGSAKSTTSRVFRALVDPNTAPVRSEPREPRDLRIAANNSWMIALDNVSYLHPWLSDALCRLSTGGGFSTRTLYEDDEETIFDGQRPVIINGIEEVATRGDLLDRTVLIICPTIPDEERVTEEDFWRRFERIRPRILGSLLDAVSAGLRNLPKVKIDMLPRMADFAKWVTACAPALGFSAEEFLDAYRANRAAASLTALESSPLVSYVVSVAESGKWSGTATELLAKLEEEAPPNVTEHKSWPRTARGLSGILRRLAPNLRKIRVSVNLPDNPTGGRRVITIKKLTGGHRSDRSGKGPGKAETSYASYDTNPGESNGRVAEAKPNGEREPARIGSGLAAQLAARGGL
jgi:hypothetical protein